MRTVLILVLAALASGGCASGGTYTVVGPRGRKSECLFREATVSSVNFYNGRQDTVSVLVPPIAGVVATDLEVLPPGSLGVVSFSVRCRSGRQLSTEIVVAPLRAGRAAPTAAKRHWIFSDNFRSVRHHSFIVGGDRQRILVR